MKRPTYGYFSLFPLLLMLIACGCSNQGKTQLQGEVTYGGQPVALGTITFTPKADGFRAIQTIKDGKFDISAKNGVQPGEYNVLVEGYEEVPEDDPDQVAKKAFPDYSTSITVEAGKPIVIDVPQQ
ncbi:MAG: carboxypeptidase regulatory-like domain-containing protein [Thermoguttaceae bacterium]|nr:carboxypeptidase regulatory-like domain-containing protein [Thermoguttaceae bacterium]